MGNMFSVPIIGTVAHTEDTKRILAPYAFNRRQSTFVRKAIGKFSKKKNFNEAIDIGLRPNYISDRIWWKIIKMQQKSYRIDYTYAIAFYWLLSLPEYRGYNKSKLMREIIISTTNGHL